MKTSTGVVKAIFSGVLALSMASVYAADNYDGTSTYNNSTRAAGAGSSGGQSMSGIHGGQTGPYVGIGVGSARNSVVKDSDTAVKGFLGYDFNKNFGIEAAYADLGKATAGADHISRKATYADGVIRMPLSYGIGIFAKGGVHYTRSSSNLYGSDTNTDATYGAGLSYDFSRNLGARAEWERFEQDRGRDDMVSASLVFKFM